MTEQKEKKKEILYLSFNREKTCLALGMRKGYRIYDLTKKDTLYFYERIFGKGIGIIEMLEKTNILGLVGGGAEPLESTNKLNIYDDKEGKTIAYINFKSVILNIRLKKEKILVILEDFIYLIDTINFQAFDTIPLGFEKQKHIRFAFTLEPNVNNLAYNYNVANQDNIKIIINFYDKDNKKSSSSELNTDYNINNIISCMEFDREGKLLAISARNYEYLKIYSVYDNISIFKCDIDSKSLNSLFISFEENNEFLCTSLDSGEVLIFNIQSLNDINLENKNKKEKTEKIWSKFYLPEKKAICTFAGNEIGKGHIICIGVKGNYYLVKFNTLLKDNLGLKIKEQYLLKTD